jgi:DHA2 family multidrug resistance protein-like MFS transporter
LATLALPTFIVAIDLFVLLLALPKIAVDLSAGANQQLWITDIYGFVLASFLVTMGTLGDRIGRRRLLLIGSVAFGVGSLVCAYSPNVEILIAARAVLGIAGATLMPSTMGLIAALFRDPKQMATAFAVFSATFTLGAVFGPVIGGFMLAHFWWGSVFLINVPIMLLLVVIGPKMLPEARNPRAGRMDATSVVLSLVALLPIIYGITELARYGWQPLPVVALAVGLVSGGAFLRRQRRLANPLLDLRLLRHRTIGPALAGMLSYSSFGGGMMMLMLLYFQLVAGMSTIQAGVALVPGMITGALGFQVWARLATRFRPGYVIAFGLLGSAVGFGLMTQFSPASGSAALIVGFATASFFGVAMRGLGSNLVVASAPREQASSAGSLVQMASEFGSTLGLAIYGTIAAAVYRGTLGLPSGVPADVKAAANDSLAGATAATTGLPPDAAAAVLAPARTAFITGLHVVAIIGVIVVAVMAAVIAVRLRHVKPFGQPDSAGR